MQLPECAQVWDQTAFPGLVVAARNPPPRPGSGEQLPGAQAGLLKHSSDPDRASCMALDKWFKCVSSPSLSPQLSREHEGTVIRAGLNKTVSVV